MTALSAPVAPSDVAQGVPMTPDGGDAPQSGAEGEIPALAYDLAGPIATHVFNGGIDGPLNAAIRVLSQPQIADALAAVDQLADARHTLDLLRLRHRPVPIRDDSPEHVVCAGCRKAWPCADGEVLWGER